MPTILDSDSDATTTEENMTVDDLISTDVLGLPWEQPKTKVSIVGPDHVLRVSNDEGRMLTEIGLAVLLADLLDAGDGWSAAGG